MILVNKKRVIEDIVRYVEDHNVTYIDACIEYCRVNNIDEETLASFIKSTKQLGLHGKLHTEAKKMHMVKK